MCFGVIFGCVCVGGLFGFFILLKDTTINLVQIWDSLDPICSTVM